MKKIYNEILLNSLQALIKKEACLIADGVSERNLCARLAMYMENIAHNMGFSEYSADTEYNRKQGGQVKTILDENLRTLQITPDLILHSRGLMKERDNLIAVEMKKLPCRPDALENDRLRLRALTKPLGDELWSADGFTHPEHVCGYQLGAFIQVDNQQNNIWIELFSHGSAFDQINISF